MPTTWGTDWDNYSIANHIVIALSPSSCCIHKIPIVTIFPFQLSCPHESVQQCEFTYNIHDHYFLVRTNNSLFFHINCYEVGFMEWFSLIHGYWESISWGFHISSLFYKCYSQFFSELVILFSLWLNGFIMGCWGKHFGLNRWVNKLHMFFQVIKFVLYEYWLCWTGFCQYLIWFV